MRLLRPLWARFPPGPAVALDVAGSEFEILQRSQATGTQDQDGHGRALPQEQHGGETPPFGPEDQDEPDLNDPEDVPDYDELPYG